MKNTASDILIDAVHDWGVDVVFGLPGDGINGIMEALPADCGSIVEQALNTPGPVLVLAVVDPYEPPMSPKVSMKQAEKCAESLLRGEPNRGKIISTIAEDRVRELV